MKRMLGIVAAALMMGTGAHAQQTFDGPYAGAEIGYTSGDADFRISADGLGRASESLSANGFEGGVFAGYRAQLPNNVVLGGEVAGLISGADGSRNRLFGDFFGDIDLGVDVEKRSEIAFSAKPGFVIQPDTMIYLIGGFQQSRYRVRQSFAGETTTDTVSRNGFHLGAGVEHSPMPNVSIRAEYRYLDHASIDFLEPGERLSFEPTENVVRIGALYRF